MSPIHWTGGKVVDNSSYCFSGPVKLSKSTQEDSFLYKDLGMKPRWSLKDLLELSTNRQGVKGVNILVGHYCPQPCHPK